MPRAFNKAILAETAHRPWKMPDAPWVMTQTWHDLLFAHWPVDRGLLREHVPPEFPIDQFEGSAWLGIVPFHMTNVAPRGSPSIPWVSAFPELNVRTYVRVGDRPGIYFFSLDAGSSIGVWAARALFNLPYHRASMRVMANTGEGVDYRSRRGADEAALEAVYRPEGSVFLATEGTLEYFLTERYCLYNRDHRGAPYRLEIHHPPWPLQPAYCRFTRNTMADVNGIPLPATRPLLHFARRQDMVAWLPARLN
jgi:uncharacterized protein